MAKTLENEKFTLDFLCGNITPVLDLINVYKRYKKGMGCPSLCAKSSIEPCFSTLLFHFFLNLLTICQRGH